MNLEQINTDTLLETYYDIRTKKERLEAEQAEALKPYKDALKQLNAEVHKRLQAENLQNTSNGHVTAFRKLQETIGVEDWDATLTFIVNEDRYDFLERRVSAAAVKNYMEEHDGQLPPGVKYRAEETCIIRLV